MLKNPYGLLNGKLVTVDEVSTGLACGCVCPNPGCGARLVAKRGPAKQSHFAHHSAEDCQASYESAVHFMAKEILSEDKRMMLPYLEVESSRDIQEPGTYRIKEKKIERQLFEFDRVDLEVWMCGRVPDVVLHKADRMLLVEIVVTHDICEEKLAWIKAHNLATIRVNMSWADAHAIRRELHRSLLSGYSSYGTNIVHWVHHPRLSDFQNQVDAAYLERIRGPLVETPKVILTPPAAVDASPTWTQRRLFD